MAFGAGDLRERITFKARTLTKNTANGEDVESFANIATTPTVSAAWLPLMASEVDRNSGTAGVAKGKFIIRERNDLSETMRLVHRYRGSDVTYAITGIEPWGKEFRTWRAVYVTEIPGG